VPIDGQLAWMLAAVMLAVHELALLGMAPS